MFINFYYTSLTFQELQFLLNRYLSDWKAYEKVIGKTDKELNDFYNLIPNESFEKMTSIQLSNQKYALLLVYL